MALATISLTEEEHQALEVIARRTGRTVEDLVHQGVLDLINRLQHRNRLSLLRQARGMWKDRTDLPPLEELRREWDRYCE